MSNSATTTQNARLSRQIAKTVVTIGLGPRRRRRAVIRRRPRRCQPLQRIVLIRHRLTGYSVYYLRNLPIILCRRIVVIDRAAAPANRRQLPVHIVRTAFASGTTRTCLP